MASKRRFRISYQHLAIIVVAVLLIISAIINVSLAYFTNSDTAQSSNEDLKFGFISVQTGIQQGSQTASTEKTFTITANEVAMMDDVYRNLVLSNYDNKSSEPFYLRLSLTFYSNNQLDTTSATVDIATGTGTYNKSNWSTGNDGKLYYNNIVDISTSQTIPLVVHFNDTFGYETFENDNPYVEIKVEIIQSDNQGYKGWLSSELPANWPKQ